MPDFVDCVERSIALQLWFENASPETLRRIWAKCAEHNPLMQRLINEAKVKEPHSNG